MVLLDSTGYFVHGWWFPALAGLCRYAAHTWPFRAEISQISYISALMQENCKPNDRIEPKL